MISDVSTYGAAVTSQQPGPDEIAPGYDQPYTLDQVVPPQPHPRRRWPWIAAGAGVLVVTVAVTAMAVAGGGNEPANALPTQPAVPTPSASPTSAAPPTTPSPAPEAGPLKLGTRTVLRQSEPVIDRVVNVTVFAYKQPVARSAPRPEGQPGYVWGAVDVRVCTTKAAPKDLTVSHGPWRLIYSDGTQAEASSTGYVQFPLPEFPWGDEPLPPGRCIRGWITFPVPSKGRPQAVQYMNGNMTEPALWSAR